MKKIYFLISAMLVMAACTNEDLFIDESNPTESALTRAALSNEYLDIKTTIFLEMDEDDRDNVNKALARLSLTITRDENGLAYLQEYHDSLNMSEELYNHIKKGTERGNELLKGSDEVRNNSVNIPRGKTRSLENGNSSNTHVCSGLDCVAHSIAHYLNLNLESVINSIAKHVPQYPYVVVPYEQLEPVLNLFGSFAKQTQFHPANATFPYPVSGIILIKDHAINGISINKIRNSYSLQCYDDQKKAVIYVYPESNQCASEPSKATDTYCGYYK